MLRFGHAALAVMVVGLIVGPVPPAFAAETQTPGGKISVATVAAQLEAVGTDENAARTLTAYIAGVIESALDMNDRAKAQGHPLFCKTGEGTLKGPVLLEAFRKAAPDPATWDATPATPIIVQYVVSLYPCR